MILFQKKTKVFVKKIITLNSKDPTKCNQSDSKLEHSCLYQMACKYDDKNICNLIDTEMGKDQCLEGMANNAQDICSNMDKLGKLSKGFTMSECLEGSKYVRFSECDSYKERQLFYLRIDK